jgi:hypothetical protein
MSRRRQTFGRKLAKKSAKEAKQISKGVLREGKKIVFGTVKGFLNAFNPFR